MKNLCILLAAAILACTTMTYSVFGADTSGNQASSGQVISRPYDSISYSKNMREDEALAKATPENNGTAQYVSGGIAISGMRAIDAEESAYNLKILFVSQGKYLADIHVKITDRKDKTVLDTTAKGPVLLVKLPSGYYMVNTKAEGGATLTRKVKVGDDYLASYVLRYPVNEQ